MAGHCGGPVGRMAAHHGARQGDQLGIVTAHHHQLAEAALGDDLAHPPGRGPIEEGGGFIEHLDRFVLQPGPQQPQPVDLTAGEAVDREVQGAIQAARAPQQVGELQLLQPVLQVPRGQRWIGAALQQQVFAQAAFE